MLFWVLVAVYVPMCLLLMGLKWALLPMADQYRPALEQTASRALGQTVHMGQLEAQWIGLSPKLRIRDFRILQPDGQVGFSTAEIRMDWSVLSLFAFNANLKNLEVLDPLLRVERDANGVVHVAGIPMKPDGSADQPGLDWLLKQKRVLVKGAKIELVDRRGQFPSTTVEGAELLMQNGFGRHRAGLVFATPLIGQAPVSVKADFTSGLLTVNPGQWRHWKGTVFASASIDQTAPLKTVLKAFDLDVDARHPSGMAWIDFEGGFVQNTLLDLSVEQIRFANPAVNLPPFVLNKASALFEVSGEHSLLKPKAVVVKRLTGTLPNLKKLGPTNLGLARTTVQSEVNWSVLVQNLNAAQAQAVAMDLLPHIGRGETLDLLQEYEFAGLVNKAVITWKTPEAPAKPGAQIVFQSDVEFNKLTVLHNTTLADRRIQQTGFRQLSGSFRGNNSKGSWRILGQASELLLPELFQVPVLTLSNIEGQGTWANAITPGVPTDIQIENLRVSNADLEAEVNGSYQFVADQSDVMNLQGKLLRADVAKVPQYIPLVVGTDARTWLNTGLKAGTAFDGTFAVRGKVYDFPYGEARYPGYFKLEIPVVGAQLNYAEGWPEINQINGTVVFEGKGMHIRANTAQTQNVLLKNVDAKIADLSADVTVLTIAGQGEGELKNMVAFANQSPIRDILNQALVKAEAEGLAKLDLSLRIPFDQVEKTQVKGVLALKNNALRLVRGMPKVTGLEGSLRFSNSGLSIEQLQGQALGGPVQFKGNTDANGKMEIRANGMARAVGLAAYLNPLMEPHLSGSTPYSVLVSAQQNRLDVVVDSTLQGLEVKLPSPLNKAADARLPLKITQTIGAQGERWAIDLGAEPHAAQVRAVLSETAGESSLDSMQFVVGMPLPPPTAGVQGDVRVASLDIDAWRKFYDQISGQVAGSSPPATPRGLLGEWLADTGEAASRVRMRIRTDQLNVGSKQFDGVTLSARTVEKRWQFDVKAKGVEGYLSWVKDKQRPEGAVLARFKTLVIPKTLDGGIKELVEEPASSIPALDVQVDDFSLNDLKLGALTLRAVNQSLDEQARLAGREREWLLEELRVQNPESTTLAKGIWRYTPGLTRQSTDIEINQTVRDAGGMLNRLGMNDVFRGGEGTLVGRLRWNDAPTAIDYATLGGQFKLTSKKGQFLKADPGVAKLLGVLSLQGISRRFTLDFKDIFSQGFAYDTIEADVALNQGVATTRNFKMTAPSATVLMDGTLDLGSETQNLNVVVLPDLNATGGSLIYSLIAANPAVGIASLIADFVLKDPLSKVFSVQYKVTGPWAAPVIEKTDKSSPNPARSTAR